ncbi:MAG: PaaI family thioesterase [Planctomycetota bacterium]
MDIEQSLQDQFAPNLICFGCGPANPHGLQIKSFVDPHSETPQLIAKFHPQSHHCAFQGMVNGGIIGALLDCHLNWTAAWHLMTQNETEVPPCCVTAKYEVTFEAPTPSTEELNLAAWVTESSARKAIVEGYLKTESGDVTARCVGTFVAVKEGHPAYHRW